jgi:hypothetical protein
MGARVISRSAVDVSVIAVALDLGSICVQESKRGTTFLAGEDLVLKLAQFYGEEIDFDLRHQWWCRFQHQKTGRG